MEEFDDSLLEVSRELWEKGMACGFGIGIEKLTELREIYKKKAMALGMYYDDEAIAAVYKIGLRDGRA